MKQTIPIWFKQTKIWIIPEDRNIIKFLNWAELKHGYQFRQYDFTKEWIKILKITQIKENGKICLDSCSYIDINRLKDFTKFLVKKWDILMALTGATIGKVARFNYSNKNILQNYRVWNFIPKNDILCKSFFYYFLNSKIFYNQILSKQTQSAQENIGKDEINNMNIIIPSLFEQKKISEILLSFDNKINILEKQNKTLENIGQVIFKSCFEDYDDFKDNLIESEMGMIPIGWKTGILKDIVTINNKNMSAKSMDNKLIIHYSIPNYDKQLFPWEEDGTLILSNKTIIEKNTILVSKLNPRESQRIWYTWDLPWVSSTEFINFISKKNNYWFLYFLLKSNNFYNNFCWYATWSTGSRQRVRPGETMNISIILPPENIIDKYDELFKTYIKKININLNQIETLKKVRDSLLPRLLNGKIRIKI